MLVKNKAQFLRFMASAFLRTLVLCLAIPAFASRGQTPQPPSGLVILTPHEGVDFTPYTTNLLQAIRRNWYAKMPKEALGKPGIDGNGARGLVNGAKGKVSVIFKIQKNGRLGHKPKVEVSSGKKPLDKAACAAIRAAAPFEQLPEPFKGRYIELRINFLYNLPLSALNP
jgi:TonB family protein